MKIFIVYAHPESRSLNGALKEHALTILEKAGHEVIVSDLYRMNWKAVADGNDFLNYDPAERLRYAPASGQAFREGMQTTDISAEQAKLMWADVIIFQFPLWWFGMPAILKGWIERVFAYGFAYGVGKHEGTQWGRRYGEGTLAGKKGMLVVTAGGRAPQYEETGVNGSMDDLLFHINHGMLWYTGIAPLPPYAMYQADGATAAQFELYKEGYTARLQQLEHTAPIAYRMQNGGDYDGQQQLRKELAGSRKGFALHIGT